ncbi:optineurin-like [Topomyia yanbarensis]|uniref:optineurin-like n=1 Tax=Topomyia yanbarensis TaxID=2498891 RepID=UPI00273B24F8|nr:optineurin-like [Topomyia yanbarensis]
MELEMIKSKVALHEKIRDLEEKNSLLVAQITEYEKLKTSCSDNLELIRTSLDNLQDLLAKCRAELLLHLNQPNQQSISCSPRTEENSSPANSFAVNTSLKSEIELLKAQLEIYKNDFAEERVARQALLVEKNRLAGELGQLQQQNRNLIVEAMAGQAEHQELNSYNQRCSPTSTSRSDGAVNEPRNRHDGQLERVASHCSLCNQVFGDIHSLETHIDECPAY